MEEIKKKILITGGSGFIGQQSVEKFMEGGQEVIGIGDENV